MSKFFKHWKHVAKHRREVFRLCSKCGLFWRGLVHDLSKFSRAEFFESAKYYTGRYSPISECRRQNGYSYAWIHHKNKNKHHIEYWYDAENEVQMNMPYKYAVECVCDKISATKCYQGKNFKPEMLLNHWLRWGIRVQTNDNMKAFFTKVFTDYMNLGERVILNKEYLRETYDDIVLKKIQQEGRNGDE